MARLSLGAICGNIVGWLGRPEVEDVLLSRPLNETKAMACALMKQAAYRKIERAFWFIWYAVFMSALIATGRL